MIKECVAAGEMRCGRRDRSTRKKVPRVKLSTTRPTRPDPGPNPGRGKPVLNHLSYRKPRQCLTTAILVH